MYLLSNRCAGLRLECVSSAVLPFSLVLFAFCRPRAFGDCFAGPRQRFPARGKETVQRLWRVASLCVAQLTVLDVMMMPFVARHADWCGTLRDHKV